ncbi:MAG: Ig-like domain-containing protein, partial [Planctomycetota bacterium]
MRLLEHFAKNVTNQGVPRFGAGRRRRLTIPERLEDRAAPGGGLAGVMATGGLLWLFDEAPFASTDRHDNVATYDTDWVFMVNVSQGPNRHFRLTRSEAFSDAAETTHSTHHPQRDTSPDYYRELAARRIHRAAERLFGEEFARLNADLLGNLPAVDELATALAAGQLTSVRAGRVALSSVPSGLVSGQGSIGGGVLSPASTLSLSVAAPGSAANELPTAKPATQDSDEAAAALPGMGYYAGLGGGAQTLGEEPNTPPEAEDDYYDLLHDTILEEYAPGVMWNDWDDDDDDLTASLVSGPSNAQSFTFNSDGSFTYEPQALWVGSDSFVYEVSDGQDTDEASVSIDVWNTEPVADDDYHDILHDTSIDEPAPGVMENDWDDDDDPITASLVAGPSHADSFGFNSDGSFTYTPTYHYVGTDTFTYHINDQIEDSDIATVTIDVYNTAPVADDDYYDILHDTSIDEPAPGVMENDWDDDDDPITA